MGRGGKYSMRDNSTIKVLLVEDNPADARLVKEMLADADGGQFYIIHVTSLGAAFERLAEEQFATLLLDLSLPDSFGIDAITQLQREAPKLPIVVLSGLNDETLSINAVKAGAQDYIVKGWGNSHTLTRALRYAIERKYTEEQLIYLAQHDHLTELPNRALFQQRLTRAIEHARHNHRPVALMLLDIDHFKVINDTLGHEAGDQLLMAIGQRFRHCVRSRDTVARLGGDEFTIILEEISSHRDVANVAKNILKILEKPFLLTGQKIEISTSIGIALYPEDGAAENVLLRNVDIALYQAKAKGRNNVQFYEMPVHDSRSPYECMVSDLPKAIDHAQIKLYYQPLLDIVNDRTVGIEALLRWQHPQLGLLSAKEIVPVIKQTKLSATLDEWVLRNACSQLKAWQLMGISPLKLTVNISIERFQHENFFESLSAILNETGLNADCLQLEFSGSSFLEIVNKNPTTTNRLRDIGVHLSIDGFGQDQIPVGQLRRLPLDLIKLDRSFIQENTSDQAGCQFIAAVIALGHSLNLKVAATGVETLDCLNALQVYGCDEVQGYHFSPALPPGDCFEWLQKSLTAP